MTMNDQTPVSFKHRATTIAIHRGIEVLITGICAAGFIYLLVIGPDVPIYGTVFLVILAIIFVLTLKKSVRQLGAALRNKEDYNVEVSKDRIIWRSPLPDEFQSFEMPLSGIHEVLTTTTRKQNGVLLYRYYICQTDGSDTRIDPQKSGVHPSKVFDALAARGVRSRTIKEIEWKNEREAASQAR